MTQKYTLTLYVIHYSSQIDFDQRNLSLRLSQGKKGFCGRPWICETAYILNTQSSETQFSYIFMPRAGIKYTHRSDKSWRLFYRFVLDNSREQRVHVTLVFRFKSAVEFRRWKFSLRILPPPSFFSSLVHVCATFFFFFPSFCFAQRAARIGSFNTISTINHFDSSKIYRVRGQKKKNETRKRSPESLPWTLNNFIDSD